MNTSALFAMGLLLATTAPAEVKVWLGSLKLPVYEEGLPDVNPPFDAFQSAKFSYPYTLRTTLTGRRETRELRAIFIENEYLKCSVLPDIGGHVYSCSDKVSGREMFYANPSLKKQLIGYRGAWAAFGIEFNFPVSHNWISMSPVDFAFRKNADGSASVFVGNIDRPYGMEWKVELVLRPGSTLLEEKVTLYNRGDMRRRYYWWNNAAVEVEDDSKLYYPMRFSASHGFTFVDTWPVNHEGLDVSVIGNHTAGPVSQFVHGSREPYMGVWHPRSNAGVVHYADYADLPAKKVWSFGVDADGLDWRTALSDNNSGYIEIQAGLFRNQETYSFLPPQGRIQFSEFWIPVRGIGGISRANLHGVVALRHEGGKLLVGLNVNHAVPSAHIRVLDGDRAVLDVRGTLDPARAFQREVASVAPDRKYTFELRDASGRVLLSHTEDAYDWAPESEIQMGAQAAVNHDGALETGAEQELNGQLLVAKETYRRALEQAPDNFEFNKAAGRLAETLKDHAAAVACLKKAQTHVSNDAEVHYYLGHAYMALADALHARAEWEGAQRQPEFRGPALLQLAQLDAREGRQQKALERLRAALAEQPGMARAGGAEVALLRFLGQSAEASERVEYWLARDPLNSFLRHERVRLGQADEGLWRHLAADPERVIEVAVNYMNLGLYRDAIEVLARRFPSIRRDEAEPGTPLPQDHPMMAYYRGYCKDKIGQKADADFRAAAKMSTRFVFPHRPQTLAVLERAIAFDPADATAHFLLGSWSMSAGMVDTAIEQWNFARRLNPHIPVLHRNLGLTLFALKRDNRVAVEVFREGLQEDPSNTELYTRLTQALSILDRPASDRVEVLERYPDRAGMPTVLATDLALSYAEAGRFRDAEQMFRHRHFEKEEGGANVRQVYLETQLLEALSLSGEAAKRKLAGLGNAVAGLDFTGTSLEPYIGGTRFEYFAGRIAQQAGDAVEARTHWQRAAGGRGVFSVLAMRELGRVEWRERASKLAIGGYDTVERGIALLAIGKTDEARQLLHDSLRAPDRNLSHYVARQALCCQK